MTSEYFVKVAAFMLLPFIFYSTLYFHHKYESAECSSQDDCSQYHKDIANCCRNASVLDLCLMLFLLNCSVIFAQ